MQKPFLLCITKLPACLFFEKNGGEFLESICFMKSTTWFGKGGEGCPDKPTRQYVGLSLKIFGFYGFVQLILSFHDPLTSGMLIAVYV